MLVFVLSSEVISRDSFRHRMEYSEEDGTGNFARAESHPESASGDVLHDFRDG